MTTSKTTQLWMAYQKRLRAIEARAANQRAVAAEEYTTAMAKAMKPATVKPKPKPKAKRNE